MEPVEYTIDADDVFVAIGGGLRGTSMWSIVDGAEARGLWRVLLARARRDGEIRIRYRCDTPTERRRFEAALRGDGDGSVTFHHRLLESVPRPSVAALEEDVPRTETLLHMCSWCGRLEAPDGAWREIEELAVLDAPRVPRITHGICPQCFADVRAAAGGR